MYILILCRSRPTVYVCTSTIYLHIIFISSQTSVAFISASYLTYRRFTSCTNGSERGRACTISRLCQVRSNYPSTLSDPRDTLYLLHHPAETGPTWV